MSGSFFIFVFFLEENLYSTFRLCTRSSALNQLVIVYSSSIESRAYNLLTLLSIAAVTRLSYVGTIPFIPKTCYSMLMKQRIR